MWSGVSQSSIVVVFDSLPNVLGHPVASQKPESEIGAPSPSDAPACSASSFVVEVTPDWHHIPVDEKGRPIRDAQ